MPEGSLNDHCPLQVSRASPFWQVARRIYFLPEPRRECSETRVLYRAGSYMSVTHRHVRVSKSKERGARGCENLLQASEAESVFVSCRVFL